MNPGAQTDVPRMTLDVGRCHTRAWSWSRCAAVLHVVVAVGGRRLSWARPLCVAVAQQVAIVSTYALLAYYNVVRNAANKRLLTPWGMWCTHVVLHYGPVTWWAGVRRPVQAWHKAAALGLHALWFWGAAGGTRSGLEAVYAKMPDKHGWDEIALVSALAALTAGNRPIAYPHPGNEKMMWPMRSNA